jgi:serine/threonine protein kinase
MSTHAVLPSGTELARFRVLRKIASGGMGSVFLAVHTALEKRVAIKVLHPEYASDDGIRERFMREGRAIARVRHPNVVTVSDVDEHQGLPYMVMEYVEGETLRELLDRVGRLRVSHALDVIIPTIDAVAAAHTAGVVHRDLKPSNIMISRTTQGGLFPRVVDFGASRVESIVGTEITRSSTVIGTPSYMAPEIAMRAQLASPQSDQYALGAILYECVTGRKAFEGGGLFELLRRVASGAFLPPRALRPELSVEFERAVLRAMALAPDARFDSLASLSAALLPFASPRQRATWMREGEAITLSTEVLAPVPVLERAVEHEPTSIAPPPPPPPIDDTPFVEVVDDTLRISISELPAARARRSRRRQAFIVVLSALSLAAVIVATLTPRRATPLATRAVTSHVDVVLPTPVVIEAPPVAPAVVAPVAAPTVPSRAQRRHRTRRAPRFALEPCPYPE